MTFEENPFRVLQVSIYDPKAAIIERADDLSFAEPDDEKIFAQARDILLNPRKRIAAEVLEMVDADIFRDVWKVEAVVKINSLYSALDAEKIREQINAARAKAKFPAVQDTAAIKSELKNIRYEIREKIQARLKKMTHGERAKFADDLAEVIVYRKNFGVIAEDFFECYRLEMNSFLDETKEKISALYKFKFAFKAEFSQFLYEVEPNLKSFVNAMKPLEKFYAALGTNNFDATKEIFYTVREVAIKLFNEKDLINYPLKISRLLEKIFSYLPPLAEVIRKDIKFLEREQALRPTQSFLDAKDAFDKIQKALDKNLHLKEGFEQENLDFYLKIFKPTYDAMITELMSGRHSRKPKEWTALNAKAAVIYLHMGTAMTWVNFHPKTALELFRKALSYAEKSGNAKLISPARQRVNEWQEVDRQLYGKSSSSGCFSVIAGAAVIFLLTRMIF